MGRPGALPGLLFRAESFMGLSGAGGKLVAVGGDIQEGDAPEGSNSGGTEEPKQLKRRAGKAAPERAEGKK